jgi:hypothetical protein
MIIRGARHYLCRKSIVLGTAAILAIYRIKNRVTVKNNSVKEAVSHPETPLNLLQAEQTLISLCVF